MALKGSLSMPIGESFLGIPYPVFYDPHYPITINNPPVTFISGSPGSGKTFAALLLAAQASISGKFNFILDPKGDFIALKRLSDKGIIGDVKVWSLFDIGGNSVSRENQGILDPLLLFDNEKDNAEMAYDIIKMLSDTPLTHKQTNFIKPTLQDVARDRKTASFERLITLLREHPDDEVRALGTSLYGILNKEIGKLLIRPRKQKHNKFNFNSGTIVASLLGLSLPNAGKSKDSYTSDERVSLAIMTLLTTLVTNMMRSNTKIKKTLFIDEAWAIMGNEAGANMISATALLGRSLNIAFVLISQSPSHIVNHSGNATLNNAISCRFAFRNGSDEDNLMTVRDMKLPEGESWERIIPELTTGQCLMQDAEKKMGVIHIIAPKTFATVFNTNPNVDI